MQNAIATFLDTMKTFSVFDFIDIAIVSLLFYYIYKFMRDKRAARLIVGLVLLVILNFLSDVLNMYVIHFLLTYVFQIGFIAIAIIFQPELRSALEKFGVQPIKGLRNMGDRDTGMMPVIATVSKSVMQMSESKTGALIVFERYTKLGDIVATGVVIDSEPSEFLINNIFFNKAPLHDGALLIRNGRLYAAGCVLPLTTNPDIIRSLGTRHRAAIGVSENSDSIAIVVSEETGIVSIAVEGKLTRYYTKEKLIKELQRLLVADEENATGLRKIRKIFSKKTKES